MSFYFITTAITIFALGAALFASMTFIRSRLDKLPYSNRRLYERFVFGVLATTGLMLAIAGFVVLQVPNALSLPAIGIVVALLGVLILRVRRSDHDAFSDSLAIACENDVPLDRVADVFAVSRIDTLSERAARFATFLRKGTPTIHAAQQAGLCLPLSVQAGLAIGSTQNRYGQRRAHHSENDFSRRITVLAPYLLAVNFAICVVVAFIARWILPTLKQMFVEFGLEIPVPAFWPFGESSWLRLVFVYSPLMLVFLSIALAIFGLCWWMMHLGYLRRFTAVIPIVGPYYNKNWKAEVLEALALLSAERPMPEAFEILSTKIPDSTEIRSFKYAASYVRGGRSWIAALENTSLVDSTGAAWLEAAQKTQRITEALFGLAEITRRRAAYRRAGMFSVTFPVMVVIVGLPVLLISYTMFSILYGIVGALT